MTDVISNERRATFRGQGLQPGVAALYALYRDGHYLQQLMSMYPAATEGGVRDAIDLQAPLH